jgi:hypothetical protein
MHEDIETSTILFSPSFSKSKSLLGAEKGCSLRIFT